MNFVRVFDIACGAVIAEFCIHCAVKRWRWNRRMKRSTGAQLTLIKPSSKLRVREDMRHWHDRHRGGGNEAS